MKKLLIILLTFFTTAIHAQKIDWIPFKWVGDNVSGKYFDKLAIAVPVTVEGLPYEFNMQFDLGATSTVFYGNSIDPYLDKYPQLDAKLDTSLKFWMQSEQYYKLRGVDLSLGKVSFGKVNIGYFEGYGDSLTAADISTKKEKHIGTIAPDLFKNKVLVIDYPNQRFCVSDGVPSQYAGATFRPYKIKDGRIKIPVSINGQEQDLLFDTGSSLFSLLTTKTRAKMISRPRISDSMRISSWGDYYMVYGKPTTATIRFGDRTLPPTTVYYDEIKQFDGFFNKERVWGITGNAYFLNNVVIIDYKNKRFGVL